LNAMDRQTVTNLAAVLRVADGLDRSHRSAVQDVEVRCDERTVQLILEPRFDDIEVELWAAGRKKKLLEMVLGRAVLFTIGRQEPGAGSVSW